MSRTTMTPLRYPGGKSQLIEFIKNTLQVNNITGTYIEPFAGGAGVAIDLLLHNTVSKIVINDYDPSIHSLWFNIINNSEKLINLIKKVPFDYTTPGICSNEFLSEYWLQQKNNHSSVADEPYSIENAFSTLMLNRMNVSGIINGGPIGGRKQSGKYKIDARFNKKTLIKKIQDISKEKNRIDLYNVDANELINIIKNNKYYDKENSFIFFDPPYYEQGKNLYLSFFNQDQHISLANNILDLNEYYWITTYDYTPQINTIYQNADQRFAYNLNYSANKRGIFSEYIFASKKIKLKFSENMNAVKQ
ncbi:hypothetical protein IV73_GL000125 [Weissella kandleri]|uniref:site-specific DNA-methyltransferase (adenine-specific) n=1 Tax=Weissella kandleri TaxID=1616 RepID=A0A0R2JNE9_9LACO|nr:DNA adenine methylase [Weissella kandleri]KRN75636.1 hypothetical protein IV73_GL000125 [Weissella kandleri]